MATKKKNRGRESKKPKGLSLKVRWLRSAVQLFSLSLFVLSLLGTITLTFWPLLPVSVPYGAFTALQVMLSLPLVPWLPLAVTILFSILLGRVTCGWICPLGFLQDISSYLKEKHKRVADRSHAWMKDLKYAILGMTLMVSLSVAVALATGGNTALIEAIGDFHTAPYTPFSPDATLFILIPHLFQRLPQIIASIPGLYTEQIIGLLTAIAPLTYIRIIILILFFASAVLVPRFWCRYLCPQGAFLAAFSRFSLLGVKRDPLRCAKCPDCEAKCPMKVPILSLPWEKFTDPECILCFECRDACPEKALKPKFL